MRRADLQESRVAESVVVISASGSAASVDVVPLCVVEHVKGFGAKLESQALPDGEMFEQRHVEVGSTRIFQNVPAHIPKCQADRSREGIRVVEGSSEARVRSR